MKRILVPLFGLSLLFGTSAALADPPGHDKHGHDKHDNRPDDRGNGKGPKDYHGHKWSRGERMPPDYRGVYVSDYHRYHLKAPPPGHQWRRVDDRYVLIAVATGVIASVILANN
jgi:Ni/Co efflux regulator RcnB